MSWQGKWRDDNKNKYVIDANTITIASPESKNTHGMFPATYVVSSDGKSLTVTWKDGEVSTGADQFPYNHDSLDWSGPKTIPHWHKKRTKKHSQAESSTKAHADGLARLQATATDDDAKLWYLPEVMMPKDIVNRNKIKADFKAHGHPVNKLRRELPPTMLHHTALGYEKHNPKMIQQTAGLSLDGKATIIWYGYQGEKFNSRCSRSTGTHEFEVRLDQFFRAVNRKFEGKTHDIDRHPLQMILLSRSEGAGNFQKYLMEPSKKLWYAFPWFNRHEGYMIMSRCIPHKFDPKKLPKKRDAWAEQLRAGLPDPNSSGVKLIGLIDHHGYPVENKDFNLVEELKKTLPHGNTQASQSINDVWIKLHHQLTDPTLLQARAAKYATWIQSNPAPTFGPLENDSGELRA